GGNFMRRKHKLMITASTLMAACSLGASGAVDAASPAAEGTVSGIEHYQLVDDNPSATSGPIVLYGVIAAHGTDQEQGADQDNLTLNGGSLVVRPKQAGT